jgi:hypothetical protein
LWEVYSRMKNLGGGPGAEIIGLWVTEFNANHLRFHPQYNAAGWQHIENLMREKGFINLDDFLRAMNRDTQLTLEFAERILESPGTKAYNAWVSKAGISAAAKGLGAAVGKVAKASGTALPVLGIVAAGVGTIALGDAIIDYGRSKDDWAMNLMNAAVVTGTFQNLIGNYYAAMPLLNMLLN